MEIVKDLLIIVLLGSASGLCVMLIVYFSKITKSIQAAQVDINKIAVDMGPLIESFQSLSKSVQGLSDDIRSQVSKTGWIIDEIKDKVESILYFERKVKNTLQNPAENIFNFLTSVKSRIQSLIHRDK